MKLFLMKFLHGLSFWLCTVVSVAGATIDRSWLDTHYEKTEVMIPIYIRLSIVLSNFHASHLFSSAALLMDVLMMAIGSEPCGANGINMQRKVLSWYFRM